MRQDELQQSLDVLDKHVAGRDFHSSTSRLNLSRFVYLAHTSEITQCVPQKMLRWS